MDTPGCFRAPPREDFGRGTPIADGGRLPGPTVAEKDSWVFVPYEMEGARLTDEFARPWVFAEPVAVREPVEISESEFPLLCSGLCEIVLDRLSSVAVSRSSRQQR